MSHSKGTTYEGLVHALVTTITRETPLSKYAIGYGPSNRVAGASEYRHQIDLSLEGNGHLHLLELKCLKKSIGVSEILILAARFADISAARADQKTLATIVSLKKPSRNVIPLARHFGISVDVVEDMQSYGLSFATLHFVGHVERVTAQDQQDATVIRSSASS